MGIDPGFRTGCKVICLDAQGNLLHNENIYPHAPVHKTAEAVSKYKNGGSLSDRSHRRRQRNRKS